MELFARLSNAPTATADSPAVPIREAADVSKRVLIFGEGVLGEVTVDQRANSPAFRISRSCVIQNLSLDMTGFRECVSVTGSNSVLTLLRDCNIWYTSFKFGVL